MTEHSSKMPSVDCQDRFDRFEEWLRENGASFESLELREYDAPTDEEGAEEKKQTSEGEEEDLETERGVHACVDIPEDTICMVVPRKCLVTLDMGKALPIGQKIIEHDLDLHAPRHIFIMLYVLWDTKTNGSASFFHPYYDILPRTFQNIPIFWSEEELSWLEGSFLLQEIQNRTAAIEEDYYDVMEVAPELLRDCCDSIDDFKWARMVVTSRNFAFDMDGSRMSALVPHADMLNHRRPCETRWTFDDDLDGFTITTLTDIPAGGQVYDSYGMKSNHRFLLNYGFSLEHNVEANGACPNMVPIQVAVSKDDPLFAAKMAYWTWEGPDADNDSDDDDSSNENSDSDDEVSDEEEEDANSEVAVNNGVADVWEQESKDTQNDSDDNHETNDEAAQAPLHVSDDNHESQISPNDAASNDDDSAAVESAANTAEGEDEEQPGALEFNDEVRIKSVRVCVGDEKNMQILLSLFRTLACTTAELAMVTGISDEPTIEVYGTCEELHYPISLRNERAAMVLLVEVISKALNQYPRSLEQDREDLEDHVTFPPFSNRRNAKIQVKGEKEVLHHYLQLGLTVLQVLDVIDNEPKAGEDDSKSFERCIMDLASKCLVHPGIVSYCDEVLDCLRADDLYGSTVNDTVIDISGLDESE